MEDDQSQRQMQTYVPPPTPKPKQEEVTEEIFVVVENQPQFPGGNAAMMKFLSDNIKYPVIAQENGIQGRVICNFVVERDGSITDVQVVRGVDPSLDREAIRVIQQMPAGHRVTAWTGSTRTLHIARGIPLTKLIV